MLDKIVNRLKNMVCKALVDTIVDTGQIQLIKVQGLAGEVQDSVERLQNFGHTSNPPTGGEVILLNIGGNKNHPVAIAVDSGEYRLKNLKPGESAQYNSTGSYIYLKEDGTIQIVPSSGEVTVEGSYTASGEVEDKAGTLDELRNEFNDFVNLTYNIHTHTSAAPGSPTGPPL